MRYLLDTDVCVDYLTNTYPAVVRRIQAADPNKVAVSSIAAAELRLCAELSTATESPHRQLDIFFSDVLILDFDSAAALAYARIRSGLEKSGLFVRANRLLVAAQAVADDLILVSGSRLELSRVPGLVLQNWRQG